MFRVCLIASKRQEYADVFRETLTSASYVHAARLSTVTSYNLAIDSDLRHSDNMVIRNPGWRSFNIGFFIIFHGILTFFKYYLFLTGSGSGSVAGVINKRLSLRNRRPEF